MISDVHHTLHAAYVALHMIVFIVHIFAELVAGLGAAIAPAAA